MILNPSCSEIVVSINARNEAEVIGVIKELVKALNGKIYLKASTYGGIHLAEAKEEEGITTLVLINKNDVNGSPLNKELIEKNNLPEVCLKIEVPLDFIHFENNKIVLDKKISDIVLPDLEVVLNKEKKNFSNVKVDVSGLSHFRLYVDDVSIRYDYQGDFDPYNSGSISIREGDWEVSAFPALKKILKELSKSYKVKLHGYDGGHVSFFDDWARLNFLDFLFKRDRYTDYRFSEINKFYVLKASNLDEFKTFLKQLEKLNFSLLDFSISTQLGSYELTKIDPEEIKDIVRDDVKEESKIIMGNKEVSLDKLALVPSNVERPEIIRSDESFYKYMKVGFNAISENEGKRFYIHRDDDYDPFREEYKTLIDFLEKTSDVILTIK